MIFVTPKGEITYTPDARFYIMIFAGVNRVETDYGRWGYTRGGGLVFHGGIDIDTLPGMDKTVHSTVAGKVKYARCVAKGAAGWGSTWEWGYFVWIVAADGTQHIFAHMAPGSLRVQEGQRVTAGQALGTMGQSGNASLDAQAEHVHYEVRSPLNKSVDPTPWCGIPNLKGQTNAEEEQDMIKMSTRPIAIKIGPASAGDLAAVKAVVTGLGIACDIAAGCAVTGLASAGDQNIILQKAEALRLIWGPVDAGADMSTAVNALEVKLADAEKREAAAQQQAAAAIKDAERQKQRADAAEKILAAAKTVRILEG